jgi:hypothetical protein
MALRHDSRAPRSSLAPQLGHLLASLSGVAFVRRSAAARIGAGGSHERRGTSALQTGQLSSLLIYALCYPTAANGNARAARVATDPTRDPTAP